MVYSCSTVFWRTEDGGSTWSAVRGAPGGDDYQKSWINPLNANIMLLVSDQGAVISANRGDSWSNWYNQPTAAVYHVTADNAFPYHLCSGQQDSGSACVDSRGMDGAITPHDWHPVGIEEYGEAAPDPKNPDLVYGGKVSLYNRVTAQKANVGPPGAGGEQRLRKAPRGRPPARCGPSRSSGHRKIRSCSFSQPRAFGKPPMADIAGPPSAEISRARRGNAGQRGEYASTVKDAPMGTVTALAPSPLDVNVLWAGTGDGLVQMTATGGLKWNDVTPTGLKPWTRIYNMEAGHFDTKTAYIAANTLRLDDMNPHFWRTHDAGKTWTEIDNGIAAGAVANSIREDPRKKGLLYAATDTQIWVSFDDGDNWQSLRLNMPAISVRDIEVKDDASCLCSDLVAGTHGRGFWILDDVTPLRQAADAARSAKPFLVKPQTAVRVRFDTNDPTPWPPEWPAGENPPAGAVVDYYLPASTSEVKLEFLDARGRVLRRYSSADPVRNPDPATDPVAYNKLCQQTPSAPDCNLPLYWPAPQQVLKTDAGMHRFLWDMHYDSLPAGGGGRRGANDGEIGAVPHRTYPNINAPWVAPGVYSVRLTAGGDTASQPITVKLDPRVKVTPEVQQIFVLTSQMEDGAMAAAKAYAEARALAEKLKGNDALLKQLHELAPVEIVRAAGRASGGGPGFGAPEPAAPATLANIGSQMVGAAMSMQSSEMPPTAAEMQACAQQQAALNALMAKWSALRAKANAVAAK